MYTGRLRLPRVVLHDDSCRDLGVVAAAGCDLCEVDWYRKRVGRVKFGLSIFLGNFITCDLTVALSSCQRLEGSQENRSRVKRRKKKESQRQRRKIQTEGLWEELASSDCGLCEHAVTMCSLQ